MKSYTPIIVVAVLTVVGLVLSGLTATSLQSPVVSVNQDIARELENVQRMLARYDANSSRLLDILEDRSPTAEAADRVLDATLQMHTSQLSRQLQPLDEIAGRLGLDAPSRRITAGRSKSFAELAAELKQNGLLIDEGLRIVRRAIQLTEQAGDEVVSGSNHLSATALEATLLYHQVDLRRQQAAVQRAIADAERAGFRRELARWQEITAVRRSLARAITPDEGDLQVPPEPVKTPAAAEGAGGKRGVAGKLLKSGFGKLFGRETPDAPAEPDESAAPPVSEPADKGPVIAGDLPTLGEQIEALRVRRKETDSEVRTTQADVDRLEAAISDLETRIADARTKADEAEQRMLALERAGVDSTDPADMERFTADYQAAAQANRDAWKEATILSRGAIRNARPDTDDEDEMLTAPLVAADPTMAVQPEEGLVKLQTDLAMARVRLETHETLLAEIDRQIEDLSHRERALKARVAMLGRSAAELQAEADRAVRAAVAATLEADRLETDALDLADGAGRQAARRAARVAGNRVRELTEFHAANSPEGTPRAQLDFITRFTETVSADFDYLIALIQAQRAKDIMRHHRMLRDAARMGIPGDQALLPEGVSGEGVPESVYQADAAEAAAEEARDLAIESAELAVEAYAQSAERLGDLWMLHVDIAAAHYLIAGLTTGEEASEHIETAYDEFERAVRDRPEVELYRPILDGLAQRLP